MSLVLCVGGGTAWGEEQTITINYNSSFTPALPTANGNTTETEHTVEGLTIKEKSIYKGASSNYLMFVQNKGFLYNTNNLGTVKSVAVTYSSGTSTSAKVGIYFGNSVLNTYTTTSNKTIAGTSKTDTWSNDEIGYGFFQLSTSNKNCQITKIVIKYDPSASNTKTTPVLNWSSTSCTATIGEENTFPTLSQENVEEGTLSYSSSNVDVATISSTGTIELKSKGTTTISAIASGTDTQNEVQASYTLTVNAAPIPGLLFNETFSDYDFSGGRDGSYSGSGVASGAFSTNKNDETGWSATNCNGASNCIKFGSGASNGTLTTRSISLNGNGTLTFSAAGWGDDKENTITVSATGGTLEGTTSFILNNETWSDYTINITGATGHLVLTFSGQRGFLDDIMVVNASGKDDPGLAFTPNSTQTLVIDEIAAVAFSKKTTENVSFSFNPEGIATYDAETGTLTALATGTTTLTASSPEGEQYEAGTATLYVIVNKKPAGLSFSKTSYSAVLSEGFDGPAVNNPNNLIVTYESSNPGIATVDASTGSVTVKSGGEVIISATTQETDVYEAGEASYTLKITNTAPVVFKQVTSPSEIISGMEYILVATGKNMAMGAQNSNDYRSNVNVTITESNTVSVTEDMGVAIFTLIGNTTDGWVALASDNEKYLSASNKNLKSVDETNATNWSITNDFQMKSGDYTIQYNSGSPRFACYSSTQSKAYLFVRETEEIAFANETAVIWNGTTYTNTLVNINGLEGSYSSSNETVATVDVTTGEATALHRGNTTISFSWETQTKNGKEIEAGEVTYVLTVKNPETFKKVTNMSEVVAGKEYILVAPVKSKAIGEENSNGSNRKAIDVTIENNKVTVKEKAFTVFTLGGTTDAWTFQDNDNSKYLALTLDDNYLEESAAVGTENKQEWTVTEDFNVVNKAFTNRTIGTQANNSDSFATYTNTQDKEYAVLFVKMPDAFDVKITAAKMGTLYVGDGNLVVPEGVTAKTLILDADGTTLVASREYASGEVLPAGEAVVIYGEAGDYSFEYTTDAAKFEAVDAANLLKGSDTAVKDEEAGYSYYILGFENGVAGFYRQKGTEAKYVNSAAHKAYLKVPNANGEVKNFYVFGGDTTTGISSLVNPTAERNVVYNLAGQRVVAPTKGLYIVNGKKVFIK